MKNPLNYVGVQLMLVGTFCVLDAASILFHPAKSSDTSPRANNIIAPNKMIRQSSLPPTPSVKNKAARTPEFYLQTTEHQNY